RTSSRVRFGSSRMGAFSSGTRAEIGFRRFRCCPIPRALRAQCSTQADRLPSVSPRTQPFVEIEEPPSYVFVDLLAKSALDHLARFRAKQIRLVGFERIDRHVAIADHGAAQARGDEAQPSPRKMLQILQD